jgi:hypothetical protein
VVNSWLSTECFTMKLIRKLKFINRGYLKKETIIEVEDESGKAVHEVFAEKYPEGAGMQYVFDRSEKLEG